MKKLKKFNEYNSHASFLSGNTGSPTTSNTDGIQSGSNAGAGGKQQSPDGPTSFGPDMAEYEDIIKNNLDTDEIRKLKRLKRMKKMKIIRNHPGDTTENDIEK